MRRRVLAHVWSNYQWPIVIALWLGFMALGYIGFYRYYLAYPAEKPHAAGDLIYYTMQLVPMISGAPPHAVPWELEVARHLLPIVEAYAVVAALLVLFAGQIQRLRLSLLHDHVVVCGLGRRGRLLARRFRALGYRTVAIDTAAGNASVEECRDEGVLVLDGDATDVASLRRAGVSRAAYLVAVCDDDGANAAVVVGARRLCADRSGPPLNLVADIMDPRLSELLHAEELLPEQVSGVRLDLLSTLDLAARALLDEHPVGGDSRPSLAVVGLGALGSCVLVRAARDWQPSNRQTGVRLRVTLVDPRAGVRYEALCARYPRLATICEADTHDLGASDADFERGGFLSGSAKDGGLDAVYVCLDDDVGSVTTGLLLARSLRTHKTRLVVAVNSDAGLARLVTAAAADGALGRAVDTFPVYERMCSPELVLGGTHETLARAIHAEYVRQQRSLGATKESNPSLCDWSELPPRLREANRSQADHIGVKLAAIGCGLESLVDWDADLFAFTPEEIERLAILEHERWVQDYLYAGWTYGPGEKDAKLKTHPDMVAWAALSEAEREKDRDVARLLPAFLARTGFQIYRKTGPAPG